MKSVMAISCIVWILALLALFLFTVIIPKIKVCSILFIIFGIACIPFGVDYIMDGDAVYLWIWPFIFAVGSIMLGIFLILTFSEIDTDTEKDVNKLWRKEGINSALRHGVISFLKGLLK